MDCFARIVEPKHIGIHIYSAFLRPSWNSKIEHFDAEGQWHCISTNTTNCQFSRVTSWWPNLECVTQNGKSLIWSWTYLRICIRNTYAHCTCTHRHAKPHCFLCPYTNGIWMAHSKHLNEWCDRKRLIWSIQNPRRLYVGILGVCDSLFAVFTNSIISIRVYAQWDCVISLSWTSLNSSWSKSILVK